MYQEDANTSKRISFQSIFSSLCNLHQGGNFDFSQLEDMAYNINERLHTKYPCEETPVQNQPATGDKQKPAKCPKCGKFSIYHNKGISKKSGAPYENYKCSNKVCDYIQWVTLNYDQHRAQARTKSMSEDSSFEANLQENYDEYPNFNEGN